jgi:hypothetical protein
MWRDAGAGPQHREQRFRAVARDPHQRQRLQRRDRARAAATVRLHARAIAVEVVRAPARRTIQGAPGRRGRSVRGHVDVGLELALVREHLEQFRPDRVGRVLQRGQERERLALPPGPVRQAGDEQETRDLQRVRRSWRRPADVPRQRLLHALQRGAAVCLAERGERIGERLAAAAMHGADGRFDLSPRLLRQP